MKTKLLRKVRKRYTIKYFPYGMRYYDDFIKGPVLLLTDNERLWCETWLSVDADSYDEAYWNLHTRLKRWILQDYKKYGVRRNKKSSHFIKLWYK